MKKFILIAVSLCFAKLTIAQKAETAKDKGSKMVTLNVGLSVIGVLFGIDYQSDSIDYFSNSQPAFEGSYEYFAGNRFSIGVQASVQHFKVNVNSWIFEDPNGNFKTVENVSSKMNRFYIGAKMLFHYKNTKKVDLYSGFRLGLVAWTNKLSNKTSGFKEAFEKEFPYYNGPTPGIIAIGGRVKFTPQIAANLELNLGVPHLFSLGLCYKFKN